MNVRLLSWTQSPQGNEEWVLEYAGRVCYRSEENLGRGEFLKRRIAEGHESLIEHASVTFEICGGSRAFTHQIVRHRIASFSQESQRYAEPEAESWVVPPEIEASPEMYAIFTQHLESVSKTYKQLRDAGAKKEDARFILPNATPSKIIVTMNLRELRHFFCERLSSRAQWEIRNIAKEMFDLVFEKYPNVFSDMLTLRRSAL